MPTKLQRVSHGARCAACARAHALRRSDEPPPFPPGRGEAHTLLLALAQRRSHLMASIAVVFESRFGQSEKIATHIADHAQRRGHAAHLVRASLATRTTVEAH